MELFGLVFVFNNYQRFLIRTRFNFEGPQPYVFLDNWVTEFPSNQSFGIKDSVNRVFGRLVLGSISYESFSFCEGNV